MIKFSCFEAKPKALKLNKFENNGQGCSRFVRSWMVDNYLTMFTSPIVRFLNGIPSLSQEMRGVGIPSAGQRSVTVFPAVSSNIGSNFILPDHLGDSDAKKTETLSRDYLSFQNQNVISLFNLTVKIKEMVKILNAKLFT